MRKATRPSGGVDSSSPHRWMGKRLHHHGGGVCWLFVLLWIDSWRHKLIVYKNWYKSIPKEGLCGVKFWPTLVCTTPPVLPLCQFFLLRQEVVFGCTVSKKDSYLVSLIERESGSKCVYFVISNTLLLCISLLCIYLLYRTDPQTHRLDHFLKFPELSGQVGISRNPSKNANRKITNHSGKHSFTHSVS